MKLHDRSLALIGAMGSGKSSLARRATAKYGGSVIDTDREFVRRYGDIAAFFAENGESKFRMIEGKLLSEAAQSGADFIATGGGAVLNRQGMTALRANCDIVYLNAPLDVLKSRIARSDRPLKNDIERIVAERAHLYERYADYVIDTSVDSLSALETALKRPRKNRYDVVLCDSDDTVLDFRRASEMSIEETVDILGLQCDKQAAVSAFKRITCDVWHRLERGELTRDTLYVARAQAMSEALGIDIDPDGFNGTYMGRMCTTRFVRPGAVEFLKELTRRGIKTYIITNSFSRVACERLKAVQEYVAGSFISESIGYYKPDKRFFDGVFNAIGDVDKARVIVFGDSETSDITGGKNYGLDTCLYDVTGKKDTSADYRVRDYSEFLKIV